MPGGAPASWRAGARGQKPAGRRRGGSSTPLERHLKVAAFSTKKFRKAAESLARAAEQSPDHRVSRSALKEHGLSPRQKRVFLQELRQVGTLKPIGNDFVLPERFRG